MRLATKDESQIIWEIVNEWWAENDLSIFNSSKGVAKRAVAEFCANQQGLTLYKSNRNIKTEEQVEKEKQEAEDWKVKYRAAVDPMHEKVRKAIEANGQECIVIYSAYSSKDDIPVDNLDTIAMQGNCVFVDSGDDFFGNGESYESDVFYNPTWLDVAVIANEMILKTGDKHHCFLEGIYVTPKQQEQTGAEIKTIRFSMGS